MITALTVIILTVGIGAVVIVGIAAVLDERITEAEAAIQKAEGR